MWKSLQSRAFLATLLFVSAFVFPCLAEDESSPAQAPIHRKSIKTDSTPTREKDETPKSGLKPGYRLQEYDDISEPIQPLVPRSVGVQSRIEALSWFMIGRLFDPNHRGDPTRALEAYRKAVKLDPEAIQNYQELIPLEVATGNFEAAVRFAMKAVELDPNDYNNLQLLAVHAAKSGRIPDAIKYLEQSIQSPKIQKFSPEFVELNRTLGQLYFMTDQKELAANCYEIIFDAIKSPEKFKLERRHRSDLLNNPLTNYEQIGQILLDANRLKLALEAFELAAAKGTKLGKGNLTYNRAKILYLSEKYEEALTELQKYIDSQQISKGRQAYQLLADILTKLNRADELIKRLESMAEVDSQNVSLQYYFADRLADVNEFERARAIYTTMLRSGGDASGYVGLARVLRKMQKPGELLDALGRSFKRGKEAFDLLSPEIKVFKDDKQLMDSMFEAGRNRVQTGQLKFEEACVLAALGEEVKDPDASGEFYLIAISLIKEDHAIQELQWSMADMYLKFKKYKLAAQTYKEILDGDRLPIGLRLKGYYFLAQALGNDNQIDEALEAIATAIETNDERAAPREESVFRALEAEIYAHARRWDDAILKWEQFIKDFPEDKEQIMRIQMSLSNIYVQKGDVRKGEEILEKVFEGNPENAHVNNDLGYLWADQGKNLERAEKMIRKAVVTDPENPAYLDSLGWVLFKLGKYDEAIPPLELATQKSVSGDSTLWDHLGDALLKANRPEKAVEAWQTGLKRLTEEPRPDAQLLERIQDKLKLHGTNSTLKSVEKTAP